MSYHNYLSGEIKIDPPITWAELEGFQEGRGRRGFGPDDVRLCRTEERINTPEGFHTKVTADAIEVRDGASGRWVVDELKVIAQAFGQTHTFTGHIHCIFEAGLIDPGEPPCERYIIRDGQVLTIAPVLTWPDLEGQA